MMAKVKFSSSLILQNLEEAQGSNSESEDGEEHYYPKVAKWKFNVIVWLFHSFNSKFKSNDSNACRIPFQDRSYLIEKIC